MTTHRLCCINFKKVGFTKTENEIHTTQQKHGVNTYMKNGHILFTACPTVTLTKSPLEETMCLLRTLIWFGTLFLLSRNEGSKHLFGKDNRYLLPQ